MNELSSYLLSWRTIATGDREVIDAVVHPVHRGPSPEFAKALAAWQGPSYWSPGDGEGRLVLIRILQPPGRERWWLHLLLFAVTFCTVWMGGALLAGSVDYYGFPFNLDLSGGFAHLREFFVELVALRPGLDFAVALMAILLAHESGHYFAARRYGLNVSPPYFLPAPPVVNFIGTFGAFIRVRSPVVDRRQLLDVGAAGPWAGFAVAVLVLVLGLLRSQTVPELGPSSQLILLGNAPLYLGDSPLLLLLRRLLVGEGTVLLHPLAFAGWLGLFVTMLNLLPLGQLDGGHVLYALMGPRQGAVSNLAWVGLLILGYVAAEQTSSWVAWFWWTWAIIVLLLGRGRLVHPQVLDRYRPLPTSRRALGWATVALFAATFSPVPLYY